MPKRIELLPLSKEPKKKTTSRFLTNEFIKDCIMQRIDTLNIDKFQDAIAFIGKAIIVKFDCDRQSECADEQVECNFRYWNNDSYDTMRKGKRHRLILI